MAITVHLTRNESGSFDRAAHEMAPMAFVASHIPDGTPFKIYIDEIGDDTDVTEDFDALQEDATFYVVESPGGGVVKGVFSLVGKVLNPILKLFAPSPQAAAAPNQQGASPNNSLTDRTNKSRPYQRTYDICGTVQCIPNDLMTVYRKYDINGNVIEFGFYDVGRGPLDAPASGITDGDTRLSEITGSSAAVYGPFTSPNSGAPQTMVGDPITEGLYVTASSNEVDGAELKAANDLAANIGDVATVSRVGNVATIVDPTGDSRFNDYMKVGDAIELIDIKTSSYVLSGIYTVTSISAVDVSFTVDGTVNPWLGITTSVPLLPGDISTTGPYNKVAVSWSNWFTMDKIKASRVLANFGAQSGMYKDDGNKKRSAAVTIRLEYQALDVNGSPIGPV